MESTEHLTKRANNVGNAMVRFITATAKIHGNRTAGLGRNDSEIVIENGFQNLDDYWATAIGPNSKMGESEFARLLEGHLQDPAHFAKELNGQTPSLIMLIRHSLDVAFKNGEKWFFQPSDENGPPSERRVLVRAAAEWLLGEPLHADRVPASLRAYLLRAKSAEASPEEEEAVSANPPHRPKGRTMAAQDAPIVRQMRELVEKNAASSPTDAARQIIGRDGANAVGNGVLESKLKRLVRRYKAGLDAKEPQGE
jgi:hypothetical protein